MKASRVIQAPRANLVKGELLVLLATKEMLAKQVLLVPQEHMGLLDQRVIQDILEKQVKKERLVLLEQEVPLVQQVLQAHLDLKVTQVFLDHLAQLV